MAEDKTPKGEVNDQNGEGGEPDETLKIGDNEMTLDEAKALVESGKTYKQLTEQYPEIDFNELPKEFTQTKQKLADLKKAQEETDKEEEEIEPDEADRRKEIDKFFEDPYVQEKLEKKQQEKEKALREDLDMTKSLESLEAEYDGEDGRPKFERVEVLKYGTENGIFNPRVAYKEMHSDELSEWTLQKALEKKRPSTFSEKRGGEGSKAPDPKAPKTFKEATEAALVEEE